MQTNRLLLFFLIILVIVNDSCIEEYTPEINKYDYNLVVEGLITNLSVPYDVKLSQTTPLDSSILDPVTNAQLLIEDNEGNSVSLSELEAGLYSTKGSNFRGVVGRRYKLTINYNENTYSSDFIELKESVGIDSLYSIVEEREIDVYPYKSFGHQFFVDAGDRSSDSTYLYWRMEETYKYNSEFPIDFEYLLDSITPNPNPMEFFTCWKTSLVPKLVALANLNQVKKDNVNAVPIYYVDNLTRKLTIRYSLLVQQLHINAKTYLFLQKLINQESNSSSLYTTQPFQIKGNMYNVNDENEQVLGNFIVAGASEKRIFVNRTPGISFHYNRCVPDYEGVTHLNSLIPPVYLSREDAGLATGDAICFDCRLRGGKIKKPVFWID